VEGTSSVAKKTATIVSRSSVMAGNDKSFCLRVRGDPLSGCLPQDADHGKHLADLPFRTRAARTMAGRQSSVCLARIRA
jgi:hypothetical protein